MVGRTRSSTAAAAAAMERSSKGKGKKERLPEKGRDGGRKERHKGGSEQRKEKQKKKKKKKQGDAMAAIGRENQFFKIFLPGQSGEGLKIPSQFQEYLQEPPNAPRLVSLKGPSGKTWEVELVSDAQGLGFTKGWKEFALDHSLVAGHLLFFTYDGRSQFFVAVFSALGVYDKSALDVRPSEDIAIKQEEEEGFPDVNGDSRSEESAPPRERSGRKTRKRVTQANAVTENVDVADTLAVSLPPVEPTGRITRKGARHTNAGMDSVGVAGTLEESGPHVEPSGRSTMKRARHTSDVVEYATTPKRQSNAQKKPEKRKSEVTIHTSNAAPTVINSNKDSTNRLARHTHCNRTLISSMDVTRIGTFVWKKFRQPAVISQRRQVTEEEKNHAFERAREFKSTNPFAVQVMMDSYVYEAFFLNIPCEFVQESLPQESKKMTLWDPQGKSWDVKYVYCNDRGVGAFSGGWGKFALGNNLEKFDVCVFELFKEDNIKVHIYRVIPEITPLVRKQHVTRCRSNFGECNSIFQKLGKN